MRLFINYFIVFTFSFFISKLLLANDHGFNKHLRISVSSTDITPPIGVPLGGHGDKHRRLLPFDLWDEYPFSFYFKPSIGIDDPIRAKAMLFKKEEQKLLFINLDLVGAPIELFDDIYERLKFFGFKKNEIFISATHTHSGPGGLSKNPLWEIIAMDQFLPEVYEEILQQVFWLVNQVYMKLEPAKLYELEFHAKNIQKNRRKDTTVVDDRAYILAAKTFNGRWLGGIINYALHGTTLSSKNLNFSSDVLGKIEKITEKKFNFENSEQTKTHFMFINSALGDISPRKKGHHGATKLAKQFLKELEISFKGFNEVKSSWSVKRIYLELPKFRIDISKCLNTKSLTNNLLKNYELQTNLISNKVQLNIIKFGHLAMFTWPGEATTNLGLKLRNAAASYDFNKTLILGLTNGHNSYFTTKSEYEYGGYEACASFHGPEAGIKIIEEYEKLLN